jgi:hypothetical protein
MLMLLLFCIILLLDLMHCIFLILTHPYAYMLDRGVET